MITLPTDNASSRHLLVRGLRYAQGIDCAKNRLVLVAEGFDASVEDRPAGYDSPWRSLALLYRICARPDLSESAFVRAEQWFDRVLAAETDNTVLTAARLTMQALNRCQAGKTEGISVDLLRAIKHSLQRVKTVDAELWSRHISINTRRLDFLEHYYHGHEAPEFIEPHTDVSDAGAPTGQAVRQLETAVFSLWGSCRLAVEVADSELLSKTLQRLCDIGDTVAMRCQPGKQEQRSEIDVVSLVRGYLAAIDFCEPTSTEAVRALDAVRPIIEGFGLQRSQAIGDRAALLLARSVVAPTIAMSDVPQMVESISRSIATCVDAAKRAGLSTELVSGRLENAFLQFAAGDVRHYCAAIADSQDRIKILKHVCSAAASLNVHLDSGTVADVTALCVAGLELPRNLLEPDAATRFGDELRRRALELSDGAPAVVSHSLQEAIGSECEKFFHSAAMEALSKFRPPHECTQLLRDSARVFSAADIRTPSAMWEAALFCLKQAPPPVFDSIVKHWILADTTLEESLWRKAWGWPNLAKLFSLLLSNSAQDTSIIASILGTLLNRNATVTLGYLFGESQDVVATMQPVIDAAVPSDNPAVGSVLRGWIANATSSSSNRDALLRESVASLLEIFPEDSAEGQTVICAARTLVSSRRAASQSTSQPHLAPVNAYLNRVRLAASNSSEMAHLLRLVTIDQEPEAPIVTDHLSTAEAGELLDLLCRSVTLHTFDELRVARKVATALFERNTVRWRPGMASLFIRYAEPQAPQRWNSKSYGREGEHLHHDRVFDEGRSLVEALASSNPVIASEATAIVAERGATNIWELALLLADLRSLALSAGEVSHSYDNVCRTCLDAILTSEWTEATYRTDGTETKIRWRVTRVVPPILEQVLCSELLKHSAEVLAALPRSPAYSDELRIVIGVGLSLLPSPVVSSVSATLAERVPDLNYWSEGRDVCLEIILQLLASSKTSESAGGAIESALRASRSKKPWTTDDALVSLLCGVSGPFGDRFTKLLLEQVSPAELASDQRRHHLLSCITAEITRAADLSNRLGVVLSEARSLASRGSAHGLGAWATLIHCLCEKLWAWRRSMLESDVPKMLAFVELEEFAKALTGATLVRRQRRDGTGDDGVFLDAIESWHSALLRGLKASPGTVLEHAGIASLLRLREQQVEFEKVSELLNALKAASPRHPGLLLACLEVCLGYQDLDGVAAILDTGVLVGPDITDGITDSFVLGAMRCFWHAEEFDLAAICFTGVCERIRKAGREEALNRLGASLGAAAQKLKHEFRDAPTLVLQRTGKYAAI